MDVAQILGRRVYSIYDDSECPVVGTIVEIIADDLYRVQWDNDPDGRCLWTAYHDELTPARERAA